MIIFRLESSNLQFCPLKKMISLYNGGILCSRRMCYTCCCVFLNFIKMHLNWMFTLTKHNLHIYFIALLKKFDNFWECLPFASPYWVGFVSNVSKGLTYLHVSKGRLLMPLNLTNTQTPNKHGRIHGNALLHANKHSRTWSICTKCKAAFYHCLMFSFYSMFST